MKKIYQTFFSMTMTGTLLVIFAVMIAFATFVENDYGTAAAKMMIYNAWWFEVLLFLLAINLTGSIIVNKLLTRKKWPVAFFHLAFVVILAGAAITRHYSYEGTMHIREGALSNQLLSRNTFLHITATTGDDTAKLTQEIRLIPGMKPKFSGSLTTGDKKVMVEQIGYIPSAVEIPVEATEGGEPLLTLVVVEGMNQPAELALRDGETRLIGGIKFKFGGDPDTTALHITLNNDTLFYLSPDTIRMLTMGEEQSEPFAPGISHPLVERSIYQAGELGFVLKQYMPHSKMKLVQSQHKHGAGQKDALTLKVTIGNENQELVVMGTPGVAGEPSDLTIDGVKIQARYGSLIHELPFALFLNDFVIERYPGSNSPSSFASEVVLIDPENKVEKPYRIFMNNILKYSGYRFFQSSYDPDEKGTILSVNYDAPGTLVTYIGYFLMSLGMVLSLIFRNTRFRKLIQSLAALKNTQTKSATIALILLLSLGSLGANAQTNDLTVVSREHAKVFGKVQVQNFDGRIEPINTLASELLRKISKKSHYQQLNPVQVMLSMMLEPEKWQSEPIIKFSNSDLQRVLGVNGSYASFNDFLNPDESNGYKLSKYIESAYAKSPAQRNKFDKEIITVDERVNIIYKMLSGGFLAIFPIPDDPNHKWEALPASKAHHEKNSAVFGTMVLQSYMQGLMKGVASGDYSEATEALEKIEKHQLLHSAEIYPSAFKTKLEVFYINFNLYSKLARIYILVGLVLLLIRFVMLLSPTIKWPLAGKAGFWVMLLLFLMHSGGLAIRWYISGHAPWSNGYETLLYISWASLLAGLLFSRRSPMTLAVTTVLSAITLFVAGMSWMSPELTNLVPVLKSYWLIIHVAVITASYGFLGMGALLALVNLMLIILRNASNAIRINITIKELSYIIEIALIVGLYLLTIGSFLGGVWANESWGRYWGWDPKETWALVTILVYAFITHMHKIPGLKGEFAFSTGALLGFASVLMTFFGVNYYLSGLHSYAQGDPPPVPSGVYIAVALIIVLVALAWFSHKRWKKNTPTA